MKLDRRLLALLTRDSTLVGLGEGLTRLFVFLLNVYVSRVVADKLQFGVFSTVCIAANVLAMLASLGMSQTAARAVANAAEDPPRRRRVVGTVTLLIAGSALTASLALLIAAPWIRARVGNEVALAALRLSALTVLGQLMSGGLDGVLRGLGAFRLVPIATVIAGAVGVVLARLLVPSLAINGGLIALGVFFLLRTAAVLVGIRAHLRGGFLPWRETRRLLGVTAAPTFISNLAWNLAMMLPPLMLAKSALGLTQLASWNASSQLRFFVSFAPVVIVNTSVPHLSALYAQGRLGYRQAASSVLLSMLAAVAPYPFILFWAGPLMGLFGQDYRSDAGLLILVTSFVLVQVLGTGLYGILLAVERVWAASLVNMAWSASIFLLAPGVIARSGAYGLAWLYLYSYVGVLVCLAWLAFQAMRRARAESLNRAQPPPSDAAVALTE